jgi:hypothetical protein
MRQEPASHEMPPAVVTGTTAQMRKPRPQRKQLVLLAAGAVMAATLGAGLGWVGNRVGLASVAKLGSRPANASAVSAGPSASVALNAPVQETIAAPAPPAIPPPAAVPVAVPAPARPRAVPAAPAAALEDEGERARKAAAATRRLRRQQRLKSNPF